MMMINKWAGRLIGATGIAVSRRIPQAIRKIAKLA
jgi:hypothetical protein